MVGAAPRSGAAHRPSHSVASAASRLGSTHLRKTTYTRASCTASKAATWSPPFGDPKCYPRIGMCRTRRACSSSSRPSHVPSNTTRCVGGDAVRPERLAAQSNRNLNHPVVQRPLGGRSACVWAKGLTKPGGGGQIGRQGTVVMPGYTGSCQRHLLDINAKVSPFIINKQPSRACSSGVERLLSIFTQDCMRSRVRFPPRPETVKFGQA